MAKLKSYKRIITSDFKKEDQELVENIGGTLNDAFNDVFFILNGRASLADNIACTVNTVDVVVDASGIPTSRTTFTLNNTNQVIGCQVILAVNQTNPAIYPTGAPFISFSQIDKAILINHITGLQPNQRWTLRIIAWN